MKVTDKLSVASVWKSFPAGDGRGGAQTVLQDVSFGVRPSEIVALVGSSGCGKTTLLRIAHGLIPPDAGSVRVDGREVRGPGPDRAMVFQQGGLLPWRTALQNVEFGLEIRGVPPAERRETALRYLRLVGLDRFAHRHPHQLSGGMQQRVGLARALALEPQVLLMDEPFSALDAQTKESLQAELLAIHEQTRKTVLFVTHDLDEAVYLADRVVVMASHPGRVHAVVDVPIPRPRTDPTAVKATDAFSHTRAEVGRLLKQAQVSAA